MGLCNTQRYGILRNAAAMETAGAFRSIGATMAWAAPPASQVDVENLSDGDIRIALKGPLMSISPIKAMQIATAANEVSVPEAWGIRAVVADTSLFDGKDMLVAVLETGIDQPHPAFAKMEISYPRTSPVKGKGDQNGHGTNWAGTIFGATLGAVQCDERLMLWGNSSRGPTT